MASASSSMLPATMSWFAAFTVWPDPAGPTWTMVFPTASSTGLAASKSAASPPTMIDRLASTAPGLATADGCVEHLQAALLAGLGYPHRYVRPNRAHVDVERALLGVGEDPVLAARDRLDVRGVGHHRDDDVGPRDGARDIVRAPTTRIDERLDSIGGAVVADHVVAGLDQVGGHRGTHGP